MATMHIYRGLPGSGKTTLARNNALLDGGRLVGRDHIRRVLGFNGIGTRRQEDEVTDLQTRMIVNGLRAHQNVHVDDMNLKLAYVRRLVALARREDSEIKYWDLTDITLDICQIQNLQRPASQHVPPNVIANLHKRFVENKGYPLPAPDEPVWPAPEDLYVPLDKPQAILVDLDGTAAIHTGRSPYDYSKVSLDEADVVVRDIVWTFGNQYNRNVKAIYLSGRPDSCYDATVSWLRLHYSEDDPILFMRKTGDSRPDTVIKRELFDEHIRYNYRVLFCLDDRNAVVDMYRDLGLKVLQVAPGAF